MTKIFKASTAKNPVVDEHEPLVGYVQGINDQQPHSSTHEENLQVAVEVPNLRPVDDKTEVRVSSFLR